MDVNVKKEIDFKNYYDKEYNNIIFQYYENLKRKRSFNVCIRIIISIVLFIISIIALNKLDIKEYLEPFSTMFIIIYFSSLFICTLIFIYTYLKNEMLNLNENIIKDILSFISNNELDNIEYEPKQKVSKEYFNKLELFNLDIVNYNGKNYTKVPYYDNTMIFSDIHTYVYDIIEEKKEIYKDGKRYIKTTQRKKVRTIFKGLYIGATLNKNNSNHIYLIPNKLNDTLIQSKIMNYIKFHGEEAKLENIEFSKKYRVFCDDEVQARYILSLSLMEKINQIDDLFKGKKYIVFKEGKRFAICMEGYTIEKIKNTKLPIFRNENKELIVLTKIFNQLNDLFKIYHILGLDNDLYTKY